MTKPNFEISVETRLLYQALVKIKPGEDIAYTTLTEAVGYKVEGGNSHLQSAINQCFRNDGIVFDNIRGVGYRRLTDSEIVDAATRDTDAIRRKSRKAAKRLASVSKFEALPPEKRIEHNARLSLFAAITSMSKQSSVDEIKSDVAAFGNQLPFAKTLEAFRNRASRT